jgi:hypothetical protein
MAEQLVELLLGQRSRAMPLVQLIREHGDRWLERPDALRPAPAGAARRPGCRQAGRPERAGAPGRPSPPARSPSATTRRSTPRQEIRAELAHDRPSPARQLTTVGTVRAPSSRRTRAAPLHRSQPAQASLPHQHTPLAHQQPTGQLTPPPKVGPRAPATPTAARNRTQPQAPHGAGVARRTTETARRTEPQPGRRKQRKREGATVAPHTHPQELRNARS